MAKLYFAENSEMRTHRLEDEPVTVGRSAQNAIVVQDPRSSRRHCRFEPSEGGFRVVDLGSQNGTFVNGSPIATRRLREGDLVEVGSVRIWFDREPTGELAPGNGAKGEADGGEAAPASAGAASAAPGSAAPSETAVDGGGAAAVDVGPDLERLKRERSNLLRLQRITKAMNSELDLERLLEIILDSAIELTDAERGFLIVREDGKLSFRLARNFDRESLDHPDVSISRSVADRVLESGEPILTLNAQDDDRFAGTQSIDTLGLRSLLCVPLESKEKPFGTIYLDNRLHKGVFSDEDLRLLETLADQAALAFETARLVKELRVSKAEVDELNRALEDKLRARNVELTETRERLRRSESHERSKFDYDKIIGTSRRMREVFRLLDRVVPSEVPVLILGASGTGKELVAKAIHYNGPRRDAPFVSENCGAVSESLLESELFGYVKGAFTGASRDRKGLFEVAEGGTIFLDEVSDMSAEMQKKLLRVLQEREVRRVGGKDTVPIDVRVISASNRDLKEMVAKGRFREDLYFRLQVLTVELPELVDRRDDIPLLARHFLERASREEGKPELELPSEVIDLFLEYGWPGNVREMENEVRRLVALADGEITADLVSPHVRDNREQFEIHEAGPVRDLNALVEEVERLEILKALEHTKNNKTRAAEALGISRFTLQRKLDKYGIS